MKEEDKEYVRAFAAMFAMNGIIARGTTGERVLEEAFDYADAFMNACDWRAASGIAAIKPKKKHDRKA